MRADDSPSMFAKQAMSSLTDTYVSSLIEFHGMRDEEWPVFTRWGVLSVLSPRFVSPSVQENFDIELGWML